MKDYDNIIYNKLSDYLVNKGYPKESLLRDYLYNDGNKSHTFDLVVFDKESKKLIEVYEYKRVKIYTHKEIIDLYVEASTYFDSYVLFFNVSLDEKTNSLKFSSINSRIGTFLSFYNLFRRLDCVNSKDYLYFFRGHASLKYQYKPSIYRNSSDTKGIEDENTLFKEAIRKCPAEFPDNMSTFEKLVKMQHYGLPTRLLDITTNPLVALYFVCSDKPKEDGEFVIFKVYKNDIRFFDSDAVSVVSNLARRPSEFIIPEELDRDKFNEKDEILYLLHEIKYEKPHFQNLIDREDLEKVFCVLPKLENPRIVKQSGAFFLFGIKGNKMSPAEFTYLPQRIIINSKGKKEILESLEMLGIDEASLFPEIDKILHTLKHK